MSELTMNTPLSNAPDTGSKLSFRARVSELFRDLRWLARVFVSSCDRFYWDNGFSKAASLAYSSLLSLVPLTVLCFGMLAVFLQTQDRTKEVQEFLFQQFMPGNTALHNLLPDMQRFSENLKTLNFLVLVTLVITSILLLNSIEYALNQVWQVFEPRRLTDRLAIFCAIIVLIPFFAVSGYYTSTQVNSFVSGLGTLSYLYEDTLPFVIDFLAFLALYYLIPKAPVKVVPACFGAIVASLLFGLAKHWFAFYIVRFASYERVYEGFALIPIFLFWLYVSWTIVLFGAEVSYQAQHLPRSGTLWKRSLMSVGDGAMVLAVQTLVLITRAFSRGDKIPNELEIAERLGCSSVVLKSSLDALEEAGIIMRGEGRDMPLLLMKSPDSVSVADVRDAVFKRRSAMFLGSELGRMYECFSGRRDPKLISLSNLIGEGAPSNDK
jgi:membrane protein